VSIIVAAVALEAPEDGGASTLPQSGLTFPPGETKNFENVTITPHTNESNRQPLLDFLQNALK